jgi:hypothetical protein
MGIATRGRLMMMNDDMMCSFSSMSRVFPKNEINESNLETRKRIEEKLRKAKIAFAAFVTRTT